MDNQTLPTPATEIKLQFNIQAIGPFRVYESGTRKGFVTVRVYYGPELWVEFDVAVFDNGKAQWAKPPQRKGDKRLFPVIESSKQLWKLIQAAALDAYHDCLVSS